MKAALLTMPLFAALGASLLSAGELSTYRGIQLGTSLIAAAKQAGINPNQTRTVHQRPALIQEMDWHPRSALLTDPVKAGSLCFLNGELFRIIVTYDPYKVLGMTSDDMIERISSLYGAATRPKVEIAYHSVYGDTAPVLARWQDSESTLNLVQTGDGSSFAMVLYSKRLDALAQAAIVEAVRLEALEAPRREAETQKRRDEADRLALEKARSINKPNFRP